MNHTKYDENVATFQCEDCGEKFGSAEDLKEHMITHSYQKCNECNQTFLHLDDIGKHMRNMHGEYGSLSHFKRQLFNHEYFDEKYYSTRNLFGNKKQS